MNPLSRSYFRAAALFTAVGLTSCARAVTPGPLAADPSATLSASSIGPSKILAVRPVSRIGAGGVSGVLAIIGAADAPREAGQEVILRDANGRVLSVLRPADSSAPGSQGPHAANEIPDS
ncbi:hypothetical protein ACOSOMT5_P1816 [Acidiphilium sp. MT5]